MSIIEAIKELSWLVEPDPKGKLPYQPPYKSIDIKDIPPLSVLLHYGGYPWVTEKCGRVKYHFPYKNPPGHASLAMGHGEHLNQGKISVIEPIEKSCRSTRRVDCIIWNDMTDGQKKQAYDIALTLVGKAYDIPGFWWVGGVKLIRPIEELYYCSESVATPHHQVGHFVSSRHPKWSTPFHLWHFGNAFKSLCEFRTVWIGSDYPKNS